MLIYTEHGVPLIGNIGFPIVLSLYLLHRVEVRLDHMIQKLSQISRQLAVQTEGKGDI